MAWIEPKTDWTPSNRFNIEDYNRIKNNLLHLYDIALLLIGNFEIENMGNDLVVGTDEYQDWRVEIFNSFENNLHIINEKVIKGDIGSKKTFYENGAFLDFEELNRIETAILKNKNALDNIAAGLRRVPFVLGQFKTRF